MSLLRTSSSIALLALSITTQACGARVVAFVGDGGNPNSDAAQTDAPSPDASAPADVVLPPSNCAAGTWCWETPSPQGIAMNAVFTVSASEAWAVGQQGAIMRYVGGRWVP
jgi:hypothetical protein